MGKMARKKACMQRMQRTESSAPERLTFILRINWASMRDGVAPPLDQLELLVDPLALFHIRISEEEGISKATSLKGIGHDHSPLEAG